MYVLTSTADALRGVGSSLGRAGFRRRPRRRRLSASQLTSGNLLLMVAGSLAAIATGGLIGRLAGADAFGQLRTVMAAAGTAGTLAQFGLATVALRDPESPGASWGRLSTYLKAMAVPIAVACAGMGVYLSGTDASHLTVPALVFCAAAAVGAVVGAGARSAGRLWATTLGHNVVEPVGLLVVTAGAATAGIIVGPSLLVVTVLVLSVLVTVSLQTWAVSNAPARADRGNWRPLLGAGSATLTVADAASMLSGLIPALALAWWAPDTAVGLYSAAAVLSGALALPIGAVNMTTSPAFARRFRAGDLEELRRLARGSAGFALTVTAPFALAVWSTTPWLLERLFGGEFSGAVAAARWLTVASLVNVATGSTGALLRMIGEDRTALTDLVAVAATAVTLAVVGVDVTGAAIAATVGITTANLAQLAAVTRRLGWVGADLRLGLRWWHDAPEDLTR